MKSWLPWFPKSNGQILLEYTVACSTERRESWVTSCLADLSIFFEAKRRGEERREGNWKRVVSTSNHSPHFHSTSKFLYSFWFSQTHLSFQRISLSYFSDLDFDLTISPISLFLHGGATAEDAEESRNPRWSRRQWSNWACSLSSSGMLCLFGESNYALRLSHKSRFLVTSDAEFLSFLYPFFVITLMWTHC